jgi:RNA polymerase sigma-70 factor (ECF subfamily)
VTARRGQLVPLHRTSTRADEISEEGVIAACAAGDRVARALLFERHVDAVHRFVGRMTCADDSAVDDLVQATFLAAYRSAGRFRSGSSVRTWLCGIAANVARTYARGEIRRKAAMSSAGEIMELATASLSDSMERRELVARLPAAIAGLRHDLRVAFLLVDVDGARGVDAAAALGVPEGTLWRRLHEARTALRAALLGGVS